MLKDVTLNNLVGDKIKLCDKCPVCKKHMVYEVYCYKCFGENPQGINTVFGKIDDKIESYIKSLSYMDLNSLIGDVRCVHKNCCNELFNRKRYLKSLGGLRYNFDKKVIFTLFDSYKELLIYAQENIDTIFTNKGFEKKLLITIDPELKDADSMFATDKYSYDYDKQLFITKTIENIKSLIEITMKDRLKNYDPTTKLARYMRYTKKTDGTLNQGKKYAYGKILDIIKEINDDRIIQVFREFKVKNLVTGENMFIDGIIFIKSDNKNKYHPVVIELDDKTHDLLVDSKYRLNDLAKNIFCKRNGISMIRVNTSDFNADMLRKILNVISGSKHAKLAAMKNFASDRLEHFNKLVNTYDMLQFINPT